MKAKKTHFSKDTFRDILLEKLSQVPISNNNHGFNRFLKNYRNTLNN